MAKKELKTNAMRILEKKKIPFTYITYECEEFVDGVQIADKLGQPHELVYKTLVTVAKSREYYVFVILSGGKIGMQIRLTPQDFQKVTGAVFEEVVVSVKTEEIL